MSHHSPAFLGVDMELGLLCSCVLALRVVCPLSALPPPWVSRAAEEKMRAVLWPEPPAGLDAGGPGDAVIQSQRLSLEPAS